MIPKKYNKQVDSEYREFMKNEQRAFHAGKRDSHHAKCEGNLW